MSLILEALKKLERDKATPERGFLVVAQAPWASGSSRRAWLVAGGLLVAAVAGVGLWKWRSAPPPGPPAAPPRAAASLPPESVATAPPLATPAPLVQTLTPPPSPVVERPRLTSPPTATERVVPPVATPRGAVTAPPALTPRASPPAAAAATPAPDPYRLEAVSEQDGVAVAIINGELVREGDHVNGALVVRIRPHEVELEIEGRRRLLTF